MTPSGHQGHEHHILAVATGRRLERVLPLALLIKEHSALLLSTLTAMLDLLLTGVRKRETVYSSCL